MQEEDKQIKQQKSLVIILGLSIFEGILSILATLLIPSDPKNAVIFGLSLNRIFIIFFTLGILGWLIYYLINPALLIKTFMRCLKPERALYILGFVSIILIGVFWVTIWLPAAYLGKLEASFIRVKPLISWVQLVILQLTLWLKFYLHSFSKLTKVSFPQKKPFLLFAVLLIGIWLFMVITKIGLVKDTAFWNVAGVPISGIQFIFIFFFLIVYWFFEYWPGNTQKKRLKEQYFIIIPALIYIIAITIWGFTPMLKHYFSLEPTAPNFQPFPYSDSRHHDIGAISILRGQGIFFKGYTDKPLYMVFLSLLHLIAQQDYVKLTWLHVIVLGLIPVMIYLLGRNYHSQILGIVLALMVIFQQRNAIILSYVIASANPKLFVTEVVMLLGMVILAVFTFLWLKTEDKKLAIILGGTIGALSLIRMNPIFMLPLMVVLGFLLIRKRRRILLQQILLLIVGFMLVFSPWIVSGVNPEGESWFIIKIMDVIKTRYSQENQTYNINEIVTVTKLSDNTQPLTTGYRATQNGHLKILPYVNNITDDLTNQKESSSIGLNISLMVNHFLHNISTSFLILPISLKLLNSKDISREPFRVEGAGWDGNFTIEQHVLILFNLIIIIIGLTESWTTHRWAGLVPLFIFLMYDLSLSFAMNSGSRYIVPINWVVFFYYAIGLIYLLKILLGFYQLLTPKEDKISSVNEFTPRFLAKTPLVVILVGLILLAAIVPIANLLVPHFVDPKQPQVDMNSLSISGETSHAGTIFYPYYMPGGKLISFGFLEGDNLVTYQIEKKLLNDENLIIQSNTPAIIGLQSNGEVQEVSDIFLIEGTKAELIWQKQR